MKSELSPPRCEYLCGCLIKPCFVYDLTGPLCAAVYESMWMCRDEFLADFYIHVSRGEGVGQSGHQNDKYAVQL